MIEKLLEYASQISNEEYHSRPNLSATGLKQFLKSPAHYKAMQEAPSVDTPAFRFGRMAHSAVLEPKTFFDLHEVFTGDRRKKEGKVEYQSMLDRGKEPIKPEELFACLEMSKATIKYFPTNGIPELSFHAEINGVMVQCRPDWLTCDEVGNVTLFDLKTCQDITQIDRNFYSYGYHVQSVLYWMVLDAALPSGFEMPDPMEFVFVEKQAPYDVARRTMDPSIWTATMNKIADALDDFRECTESGVWPGVEPEQSVEVADCPDWVKSDLLKGIDLDGFYNNNESC